MTVPARISAVARTVEEIAVVTVAAIADVAGVGAVAEAAVVVAGR
jgi:hypothetical protein